jgi:hypothetical protein
MLERQKYIVWYALVLTLNFATHVATGNTLWQIQPVFYGASIDISESFLFLLNIPKYFAANPGCFVVIDLLFLLLNILMGFVVYRNKPYFRYIIAICIVYNLGYGLLYNMFTHLSIQGWLCFVWVPIVFWGSNKTSFYFSFFSIRLLFALFFFSAAAWKLKTGSIFNTNQMSAILFQQHAAVLHAESSGYSNFIHYFINHNKISFSIYWAGFLCEFSFLLAFFTKRFDKLLFIFLLIFVVLDFVFMKINYFSWLCYAPLFLYSNKVTLQQQSKY